MIIGSGDPLPYDLPLVYSLATLGALLLIGACFGKDWSIGVANVIRRGTLLLSIVLTLTVLMVTPTTNGIAGAGRMLLLVPVGTFALLAYGLWAWRAARI